MTAGPPSERGDHVPIRTLADIEALERVPLAERIDTWDIFELIERGAAIDPGKVAIHYLPDAELDGAPWSLTYGALMGRFRQAANLFHDLGVGPSDVVAYVLPTMPENYFVQIGGLAAGIACCVNWMLEARQIGRILRASRAKVVVALGPTPEFEIWQKVQAVRDELPDLRHVLSVEGFGGAKLAATDLGTWMARFAHDRLDFDRSCAAADVAAYVHSGGTTGAPKLAKLTHQGFAFKCWANTVVVAHGADDCIFADYPMFHIAGFFGRGILPLVNGMTIVIPSAIGARSKAFIANYWKLVERFRITFLSGVPTTLSVLADQPPAGADVGSLRAYAPTGSAALPVETAKRIERTLGVRMLVTFGATEFTQNVTMAPRDGDPRYGSAGIRLPYVGVKTVVVDDGAIVRDCDVDQIGVIAVKGPNIIPGYVDAELDDGLYFADGWINSGDMGRIDAEGYLWVTGRAKDIIIRGGHNIDPSAIEDALMAHDAVQLAAAVGKPDAYAGELPIAYVQLRDGAEATPEALRAFARRRIPERGANPSEIILTDRLPLTDIGKPDKVKLRHDAARRGISLALRDLSATVDVASHATHGTLVTITLSAQGEADTADMEASVRDILDRYAFRYDVVWSEG